MRRTFLLATSLLAASLLLAGSVALAQDAHANGSAGDPASQNNNAANTAQYQNPDTATKSSAHTASVIRGCLSGSAGNYTLTDQNGMQYQVSGDDASLRSMVGREVEISGIESQSSAGAASNVTNGVQASEVRAVSSTCKKGTSMSAPPPADNGVSNSPQTSPQKGSPDAIPPVSPDKQ
jgi:hypothetical protein